MIISMRRLAANRDKLARTVKEGRAVILTEDGVPVAIVEPLKSATKEEEAVIQEMIKSGRLQRGRKSDDTQEWRYRHVRTNAA
jgi:antitoxin (DNA-binding transcriptional repressor) of toxin-antitoxin stability system